MARPKIKDIEKRVKGGYSISRETNDELEKFIKENMMVKSRVIEKAIQEFLERRTNEKKII